MELNKIKKVNSRKLAEIRLQADPLWKKLDERSRGYYINGSLYWGENAAKLFLEENKKIDINSVSKKYGIKIVKSKEEITTKYPTFVAERSDVSKRIMLNGNIASMLKKLLEDFNIEYDEDIIWQILFYRAFYYYFANDENLLASKNLDMVKRGVFFRKKLTYYEVSDLAASDCFTNLIIRPPIPVGVLAYLQLIISGKASLENVLKYLLE